MAEMDYVFSLMDGAHPGRTVCNMRLRLNGTSAELVAVHPKEPWGSTASQPPLLRLGDGWLCGAGTTISHCDASGAGAVDIAASLPGDVAGAVPMEPDRAMLVCHRGFLDVDSRSGVWGTSQPRRRYPAVRFRTVNLGNRTYTVGERRLGAAQVAGTALTEAGRQAVTADLANAYESLSAEIAADGLFCAPVVARCRYLDAGGRELFVSPPVFVAPPVDFNPWVEAAADSSWSTVMAYTLEVPVFRIEAVFEGQACPQVHRVEIALSPALHPYRAGGASRVAVLRTPAQGLRISLPGYGCATSAAAGPRLVERVIERLDGLESPVASVVAPFSASGRTVELSAPLASAAAEGEAVDAALQRRCPVAPFDSTMLAAPHSFGASVVCAAGPTVAYGGLTAVRFEGYSPEFFAGGAEAEADWTSEATVRMADGSAVLFTAQHSGPLPGWFGPVLSYPAPDAVELTLVVRGGGKVRRGVYPLHPDASGRRALYIAPQLAPVVPEVVPSAVSAVPAPAVLPFADVVAFASGRHPTAIEGLVRLGGAPATALAALRTADSAWEYGRHRFVAATASGLFSIALGSGTPSVKMLAPVGVAQRSGLVSVDDAVYAATAQGLIRIAAGRRRAERVIPGAFVSLAWDGGRRELMALGADVCTVWCPDLGGWYLRPDCAGAIAVHAGEAHFLATGAGGPYLTMDEDESLQIDVRVDDELTARMCQPRRVSLWMRGWCESASASLSAAGAPVWRLDLAGTIRRPLVSPVLARPCAGLRLTLEADTLDLTLSRLALQ